MRPPETWSAVTASFAKTLGCRNVVGETSAPRRSFVVMAASALIVPHASSDPRPWSPATDR